MKRAQWIVGLVCLYLVIPDACFPWSGKVVEIVRADEIRVMMSNGTTENIRLYGIDSPGEPQPFGREAKLYTTGRVLGKTVEVIPIFRDNINRVIAYVNVDGQSLVEELLRNGMTWWYRKYVPWELGLANLEAEARKAGVGLWADSAPIPPWEFQPVPPSEGAGPTTPFSNSRRRSVREKIISEVGRSRKVIGDEGTVKRRIESLYRPEGVKEPPNLEYLERYKRYFERSRKKHE
jgi:micrococcal nuclease